MLVTLAGISILVKLLQSWKADVPMLVTLLGIVMLVKLLQPLKADELICVMPVGITRSVTFVPLRYKSAPQEHGFASLSNEILNQAVRSVMYTLYILLQL